MPDDGGGTEIRLTATQMTRKPLRIWLLLASLYMTQFLGLSFFWIALVVIMRRQGAPMERLGVIYLLGLFWAIKFLWAPLVDRFAFGRLGHYRGWLLLTQSGMVLNLIIIGCFDISTQFGAVLTGCVVLAFLSSTQDIAADGLTCRLLSAKERGLGNGIQYAGGMLGNVLGGGVVLMAYPHIGWKGCMAILALCTSVSLFQVLCFREKTYSVACQNSPVPLRRFWSFWQTSGHKQWFLLLLIYPIGSTLAHAILAPMMVDVGWSMERIGMVMNILGSILSALSSLFTGWLLRWRARSSVLIGAATVQVIGLLAITLSLIGLPDDWRVHCSVGACFLIHGVLLTLISTMMMDRASLKSPATDFTLQFSAYYFLKFVAAAGSTILAGQLGYLAVLMVACAFACLALVLALYFKPTAEKRMDRVALGNVH
ncbi:MFS transporter [Desulfosarcina ovata]|uniref:MFS transporter n=2 Tax=Desulfosarcina ovata TaxID=83564 RepID=A0A5K8AII8_9BACT|nr:MFS transporter [Desulfosarcina ovata]BBO85450.1 MFS transporter [Desulfosarcina ovata subsp. sediminis]BBO92481.1 MFS transporter [Desulfosarcina ovata subsp. ovata]